MEIRKVFIGPSIY